VNDPFGKSFDKDRTDREFPGEVVDGTVTLAKLSFNLFHDFTEVLVIGKRDIQNVGKI
jgi:hypothetical protein